MEDFLLFFSKNLTVFWVLITINLCLLFYSTPEKIIKYSIISNIVFFVYILSATLIERFTWFPDLELADNMGFITIFLDVLYYNSNRFIYTSGYILVNMFIFLRVLKLIKKNNVN